MATLRIAALAALTAFSLGACDDARKANGVSAGAGGRCIPFATTTTSATTTAPAGQPSVPTAAPPIAGDPAAAVDDCLHRWGYALASSTDEASQVAAATVAACTSSVSRWNQAAMASGEAAGGDAPSLMNGQQTNPMSEHFTFAQGRALFYVVQARAGKCAAPPMANGAPVGLAD